MGQVTVVAQGFSVVVPRQLGLPGSPRRAHVPAQSRGGRGSTRAWATACVGVWDKSAAHPSRAVGHCRTGLSPCLTGRGLGRELVLVSIVTRRVVYGAYWLHTPRLWLPSEAVKAVGLSSVPLRVERLALQAEGGTKRRKELAWDYKPGHAWPLHAHTQDLFERYVRRYVERYSCSGRGGQAAWLLVPSIGWPLHGRMDPQDLAE